MLTNIASPRPQQIKLTALSAVNCRKLLKSRSARLEPQPGGPISVLDGAPRDVLPSETGQQCAADNPSGQQSGGVCRSAPGGLSAAALTPAASSDRD